MGREIVRSNLQDRGLLPRLFAAVKEIIERRTLAVEIVEVEVSIPGCDDGKSERMPKTEANGRLAAKGGARTVFEWKIGVLDEFDEKSFGRELAIEFVVVTVRPPREGTRWGQQVQPSSKRNIRNGVRFESVGKKESGEGRFRLRPK